MNTFVIYHAQFDIDRGDIKKNDTTVIGEINRSAKAYENMTDEEAARTRLKAELCGKKRISEHTNNYLYNHITNFTWQRVSYDKEAGADKQLHKYIKEQLGIPALRGEFRDTEFFNLGERSKQTFAAVVDAVFHNGATNRVVFTPRQNQERYINELVANTSDKFLLGALCRFGKSAATLYACTEKLGYKKILILSAKCDTKNSWQDDFYKWTFTNGYDFVTKTDLNYNASCLDNSKKTIAWMSLRSSAKNYDEDDDYQEYETESWQKVVAKYKWDIVIIDECHFGSDTIRSQKFIKKILGGGVKKLEISATPFKKLQRKEYADANSFIYNVTDEVADVEAGIIDKHNYVPLMLAHLDLHTCYKQNAFGRYGEKTKSKMDEYFQSCYKDCKFSWDAYFGGETDKNQFNLATIREHFTTLYDYYFAENGRNTIVFVNKVENGNRLADALRLSKFTVYNVCGSTKYTLAEINRAMLDAEQGRVAPVVVISCGRYLTGVTMRYLHNVVLMGTCNSPENYFQYWCRAKNLYDKRVAKCAMFDLNPKTLLELDSFKELVQIDALYHNDSMQNTAKKYEAAIEIFELNNSNVLVEKNNFIEDFEKTMYTREDGGLLCDMYISQQTLTDECIKYFSKYITPSGNNIIKLSVTEEQVPKAKMINKPERDVAEKADKKNVMDIQNLLTTLRDKMKYVPVFMAATQNNSLDEIIIKCKDDEEVAKDFYAFTHFPVQLLADLKNMWEDFPQNWNNLNDACVSNKNALEASVE